MKSIHLLPILLALTCATLADAASKPNIIVIFSDDHGYSDLGCQGIFDDLRTPNIDALSKLHKDPKTALQEWSQHKKLGTPHYEVIEADGPAHDPAFTIEVRVKSKEPAQGAGRSKRQAQMAAARAFLMREKIWTEND